MPYRTSLRRQLDKRLSRIAAMLQSASQGFDRAAYHRLRVEIKKARALFDLMDACSEKFHKKQGYAPLKTVFGLAGGVRDLHVSGDFLKKYRIRDASGELEKEYSVKRIVAAHRFRAALTARLFENIARLRRQALKRAASVKDASVKRYFEKTEKRICRRLQARSITEEGLHKFRQQLKHYYYNRKAMGYGKKASLKSMDEFQLLLGRWHDCVMADDFLSGVSRPGRLPAAERRRLERALKGIRNRRKELLAEIGETRKKVKL
jgi:CHAD domain-containing protein